MMWKQWETVSRDGRSFIIVFPYQPRLYGIASYNTIHHYWMVNGAPSLGLDSQGCLWTDLPAWPQAQP